MTSNTEPTCRYGVLPAHTFTHDDRAQTHARYWAAGFYGQEHADLFVAWLLTLSDLDQDRIYHVGYPLGAASTFEHDYPDIHR